MVRRDCPGIEDTAPFDVLEPLMLVSVGPSYRSGTDPYEAARFAWIIDRSRVDRYHLVLAHCRGVVVGAFRPESWLPASSENFSGRETHAGRWGFVGTPAEPETARQYIGRRVPDRLRRPGAANPVRYCEPLSPCRRGVPCCVVRP
ncbi:MAG: hypothetical protein F4018_13000 [Acidobacteria bacterium]|nr:hypothetical protein [Chloroflexota bacterium]MYK89170.1 hypothetical protein [Acidobacteriota bacterium]